MRCRAPTTALVIATAAMAGGCLPIAWTEPLSPPVVGSYTAFPMGGPVAGARVALSTTPHDSACAAPARVAVTDSSGAFSFPGTEVRHPVIILLPIDQVRGWYHLCGQVGDSLRPMFRGWFASRAEVRSDTVACQRRHAFDGSLAQCTTRDPKWNASESRLGPQGTAHSGHHQP